MKTFQGYLRPDGQVGVRNHVIVIANASCANGVVNRISKEVPELVPLIHTDGCSAPGEYERWRQVLIGVANNPNVYATLLIGVGCETDDARDIAKIIQKNGKPIFVNVVQDDGGGEKVIQNAVAFGRKMVEEAKRTQRVECPISKLIVATECGGSDAFSGLTANRVIGYVSDWIVAQGATSILTETTELIGTEDILAERAVSREVAERIKTIIYATEEEMRKVMGPEVSRMIARGNMAGGITTVQEKAMGCVKKGGNSPITAVVDYAEPVFGKKGLVIMDGPGYDPDSLTGMFASGAQVMLFSTGRGNPLGFPVAPVIKICSNSETYFKVGGDGGDMDINAGEMVTDGVSLEEMGDRTVKYLLETINGRQTSPERHGYGGALCVYSKTMPF